MGDRQAVSNASSDVGSSLGFMSDRDSMKVIINFGDNMPHETDMNGSDLRCVSEDSAIYNGCGTVENTCEYFRDDEADEQSEVYKRCIQLASLRLPNVTEENYNNGVDPGPDNDVDCSSINANGDGDIDFQEDALMGLIANHVRLIHIDSSENVKFVPYWSVWTHATGGGYARINRDGTSPDSSDADFLPILINELLGSIPLE